MFKNYFLAATRHLWRHKLYTIINMTGLAMGLAIFVFAQLFASYEQSHDQFWPDSERIYGIYTNLQPGSGLGIKTLSAAWSAVGPLISETAPGVAINARSMGQTLLARYGERRFDQSIRFVDPAFLDIFTLDFVAGDPATALTDPSGLIITESVARKYFGDGTAMGELITVNLKYDLRVTGVVKDIPRNSHFETSVMVDMPFEMIATYDAFVRLTETAPEGDWYSLLMSYNLYLKLAPGAQLEDVNLQLEGLYDRFFPEGAKEMASGIVARPIEDLNLFIWQASGIPAIASLRLLGLMILILASLNYANLATAQIMGRTREVGLRRIMGASRPQLFSQFIVESMILTAVALLIAISMVDLALPYLNAATNKVVAFNYVTNLGTLGWLALVALTVGGLAGAYPAFLISKGGTVGMLRGEGGKKAGGSKLRSGMLVMQFTISVFMMIAVAIIYAQNARVETSGEIFAQDRIVILDRVSRPEVRAVSEALRNEMLRIPGVETFSYSGQVPFEQSHSTESYSRNAGDEAGALDISQIYIDQDFIATYDVDLVAGRGFSEDFAQDKMQLDDEGQPDGTPVNVVMNRMATRQLGWDNPKDAIGGVFYRSVTGEDEEVLFHLEHRVVGVVEDFNFLGFFNPLKPIVFSDRSSRMRLASLRISGDDVPGTLAAIDAAWDRLAPEYPINRRFLTDYFEDIFDIFRGMITALAVFAAVALLVSVIGLFGLAAFMARKRTKEIGIRKVLGASVAAIVRLLVWQFSRPVVIAILLATPLGYLGARAYLNFFADRVSLTPVIFLTTAFVAFGVAALTVSFHAVRAARANPVHALRYE